MRSARVRQILNVSLAAGQNPRIHRPHRNGYGTHAKRVSRGHDPVWMRGSTMWIGWATRHPDKLKMSHDEFNKLLQEPRRRDRVEVRGVAAAAGIRNKGGRIESALTNAFGATMWR